MEDKEIRAELERIKLHELWDHCVKEEPDCDDTLFRDILDALHLLASKHKALREIRKMAQEYVDQCCGEQAGNQYCRSYSCPRMMDIIPIAKTAIKEE